MHRVLLAVTCILFGSCVSTLPKENTVEAVLGRAAVAAIVEPETEALDLYLRSGDRPVKVVPGFTPALERLIAGMLVDEGMSSEAVREALNSGMPVFRRDFASFVLENAGHNQDIVVSGETLLSYVTTRKPRCHELPCPIPPCKITCFR